MQFTTIIATTLLAVAPVFATPANSFYGCSNPGFQGKCYEWDFAVGVCYNFDAATSNTMSSYRSPSDGKECTLFTKPNCGRTQRMVGMQAGANYGDLRLSEKGNFDNVNRSFRCGVPFVPWLRQPW